jgi:hypothetical protein
MPTLLHPIYLPADLLEELAKRTGHFWSGPENEAIVVEAVRALLKPEPAAPSARALPVAPAAMTAPAPVPAARSDAGYQWKQVFLPEGTTLRACFGGRPYFATVEGAQIQYGGHAISPSGFANLHGSGKPPSPRKRAQPSGSRPAPAAAAPLAPSAAPRLASLPQDQAHRSRTPCGTIPARKAARVPARNSPPMTVPGTATPSGAAPAAGAARRSTPPIIRDEPKKSPRQLRGQRFQIGRDLKEQGHCGSSA